MCVKDGVRDVRLQVPRDASCHVQAWKRTVTPTEYDPTVYVSLIYYSIPNPKRRRKVLGYDRSPDLRQTEHLLAHEIRGVLSPLLLYISSTPVMCRRGGPCRLSLHLRKGRIVFYTSLVDVGRKTNQHTTGERSSLATMQPVKGKTYLVRKT